MSSPPKFIFHNAIYFVTTSIEEGLMLTPNETTRELVLKSIAQAQKLHYVEIIDVIILPTHIHLLVRVVAPSDFISFMKCFKCEVAHAINGILGKDKRTVWCNGYDSPYIPDLETAMDKIAYIYSNPSNDHGEDSIDKFPGFNTFNLRKGIADEDAPLTHTDFPTYYIPRPEFTKIKDHTPEGYRKYRARLVHKKKKNSVTINPNAIFHKFGITDEAEIRRLNAAIVADVRQREEKNRIQRQAEGKALIGAKRLASLPIGTPYIPHRTGRRMRVHCNDRELRIKTLTWMRELYRKARIVFERWKLGDTSVPYPMGLFPPSNIRLVEPLGW